MAREIRVTCKGRTVSVETVGFGGESCKSATEGLERKLGKVTKDVDTDDRYQQTEDVHVGSKA